ncbi:MAG TPA: NUDIX domain-containing protein [Chthoniobacterales bacterium]|nr:NUDIX domain-containing protein [Chthoniobacterales bacterium]
MSAESTQKRSNISAGLLMFRRKNDSHEFLLVHPGGPFWKNKDDGAWTIPKGEAADNEDLLTRAQIEFEEEVGFKPSGTWISLGSIKQKGGKTVHCWGFEGDLPQPFELRSNKFQLEWPPRSGKFTEFPEVDRAEFFPEEISRRKINPAQVQFIDNLRDVLTAK